MLLKSVSQSYGIDLSNTNNAVSISTFTCGFTVHSLYGCAAVVALSSDKRRFNAAARRSNGFKRAVSPFSICRLICFHLHSNWSAALQSGNPATWQARVHFSPAATLALVAAAPPLISLLCCLNLWSKSTVAPTYVAPPVDTSRYT